VNELLETALGYASRGWPVFPSHGIVGSHCTCGRDCSSPGKHPLVRRGLHEATTDARVIKEWWGRWPNANIAIPTAPIVVIDIDLPAASDSLDALVGKLPRTLTALTGGGGVHLYFWSDRQLRNHASHLPGIGPLTGVDLRAGGGYVVAPPSVHISGRRYSWLDESTPIAAAPIWLCEPPRPELSGTSAAIPANKSTAYGIAALRAEIDILLRTPVGRRNDQLNRAAFRVGQLIAAGQLAGSHARQQLEVAGSWIGLETRETRRTAKSGIEAGMTKYGSGPG
jgi:hypothetical protein